MVTFLRWKETKNLWKLLRGSVFVLLALAFASLLELFLHFSGWYPPLEEWLRGELHNGVQGIIINVVLLLSIFIVALHHFKESRKPEYESIFVKQMFDFTTGYRDSSMKLAQALERFHEIFLHSDVDCLAVFMEDGGSLKVKLGHVYPPKSAADHEAYFPVLPMGGGIAGNVYQDKWVRYMPTCFLGGKPFKHALKFDTRTGGKLSEEVADFARFQVWKDQIPFKSLVCVPVPDPSTHRDCAGVLSITFKKPRTLDRSDITMAALVGMALGQALPDLDLQ